jgi:hypothetical protein
MRKMKLKMAMTLIAVSFIIIAMSTPATAYHHRILFLSIGDDLDLPDTTDCIIGTIRSSRYSESTTAQALFYFKIYDQSSGEKYVMTGMFKGELQMKQYSFFCPVFQVYFINVWLFMGEGIFMTTDTELTGFTYRKIFTITMPNTEGEYVKAPMVMLLSPTAEYCAQNPVDVPPGIDNPISTEGIAPWVLVGVLCGITVGGVELPIGPVSALTISFGL